MRQIRVAEIVGVWNNYGVETLTLNCYRNMDKEKVQCDFFVCEGSENVPVEEIEKMGGRVYFIPGYKHLFGYLGTLKRIFRKNQYEIVHSHVNTLAVFPLFAAWRGKVPVRIVHIHSMSAKGELLRNIIKGTLKRFSKMFATHLATSSQIAARWMFGKKCFDKYDIYYLPVARDLKKFLYDGEKREEMRKKLGLEDKFVIGHLGRFCAQKNHSFLIDVFANVCEKDPKAVLLLAGEGKLLGEVQQKIKTLGIEDKVLYLGQRSDVEDLYQAMDVFVLPSLYEGVPGVGVEAQAAGLPFVFAETVTDEIGILESAYRLPFEDGPEKWANVILETKKFQRKSGLEPMKEAGFEIQSAAKKLEEYYGSLVRE